MFILDDILLSPVKGFCHRVEEGARHELKNVEKEVETMSSLNELHHQLEMGEIDERAFEHEESRLLEQIERLATMFYRQDEPEDW